MFLQVGYSLKDTDLIKSNSDVVFSPEQVANKLGAMLNSDSAEQVCI